MSKGENSVKKDEKMTVVISSGLNKCPYAEEG